MPRRYSDGEIIDLIRNGEDGRSKGIKVLYIQNRPKVFPYIAKKIGNGVADDIIQQTILTVTENIIDRKFLGKSSLSTYFFGIARNLCLKKLQREGKNTSVIPVKTTNSTPESDLLSQEVVELVQQAMQELSPQYREVLSLWILKYSMQEIAEKLGYSSATVARVTKSRALKELEKVIENNPVLKRALKELYDQI